MLYIEEKTLVSDETMRCESCDMKLSRVFVWVECADRKGGFLPSIIGSFCNVCVKKISKSYPYRSARVGVVKHEVSVKAIKYYPRLPSLSPTKNNSLSVFEVANKQLGTEKTVDRTVLSSRNEILISEEYRDKIEVKK